MMLTEDKSRLDAFIEGLSQFSAEPLVLEEIITDRVWLLVRASPNNEKAIAKIVYLEEEVPQKRFRLFSVAE